MKENKNHIKRAATQWETWITKLPKWSGFNPSEFPIERRKIEFCIFNIFPPPPLARQMMFGIYAAAYTERRRFVWIWNEYRRSSLLNNYFPWKASRLFQHQNEKKLLFFYWFSTSNQKVAKKIFFLMFYWCFYNKLHFLFACHAVRSISPHEVSSLWRDTLSICFKWNEELML